VHDIDDLERRGVPGVFVASGPFEEAAEVQARALGLAVRRVFVEHPIQDRTDEEMSALADDAVDALVEALTSVG
jgi:hypothetical protein|tara:strand:+ start:2294 stop:2515 length:222 start_codon:yes stop_codon:yes gene_type:complete